MIERTILHRQYSVCRSPTPTSRYSEVPGVLDPTIIARIKMPGIKPEDCKPGDIVLFYGFNLVSGALAVTTALKGVTVLPAVVSAVQGGTTAFSGNLLANHAGIICEGPEGTSYDLAHATNENGVHRKSLRYICAQSTGTLQVFRSMIGDTVPKEAAQVASTWARRIDGEMKFDSDKATGS